MRWHAPCNRGRMIRQEWDRCVVCVDCDQVLDSRLDPVFLLAKEDCLCLACAVARGGTYEARHQVWTQPPDLSGLV